MKIIETIAIIIIFAVLLNKRCFPKKAHLYSEIAVFLNSIYIKIKIRPTKTIPAFTIKKELSSFVWCWIALIIKRIKYTSPPENIRIPPISG